MSNYVLIAIGGAAGALARYGVAAFIQSRFPSSFPWGTFVVNVSGCFAMGLVVSLVLDRIGSSVGLRVLLAVGFIGAYTTFSTYAVESITLFRSGDWLGAAANIIGTNLICLLGAVVGLLVGAHL